MRIRVLLFGPEAVAAGMRAVEVEVGTKGGPVTPMMVIVALADSKPELRGSLATSRIAVNHQFVGEEDRIGEGDEVALIGMVSGG